VDEVRANTLRFLGADPEHFDLVFVANATAAIKLVADSFRDLAEKTRTRKFWYGYHKDAHTSLVGVREYASGQHHCFESDEEVESWLGAPTSTFVNRHSLDDDLGLFAYPGQSNMSGRRLPLSWAGSTRRSDHLQNTCM
jgi:molybdenum cofactor sulfurtransferase